MELAANDAVWLVPSGNAAYLHGNRPYVKGTVKKVGHKYYHIDIGHNVCIQLEKDTNMAYLDHDYNAYYKVFSSWKEYLEWQEKSVVESKICDYFHSRPKLSLDALRKIYAILHDDDPDTVPEDLAALMSKYEKERNE